MRKVFVSIKRVVDFNIRIRVKENHSGIETSNVKMSMNPFDEIAVEAAVRLQEKGLVQESVAVSIGPEGCKETLRTALAMGLTKAIHIHTDLDLEPINVAKLLQQLVLREPSSPTLLPCSPDVAQRNPGEGSPVVLVIMGKQAIDDDSNQTGQMLAARLDWPQGTFASQILLAEDTVTVTREVDGGLETLNLNLPAVITTDLRLNTPRYLSLPNIMKAKQKAIETIPLASLRIDTSPHCKILDVAPPTKKKGGIKVASVQELVAKLHEEAKVL